MVNLLSKSILIVLDELEYRLAKLIDRKMRKRALRKELQSQNKRFEESSSGELHGPEEPVTSPSEYKDEIRWASERRD
jgi:hypothetical protein